MRGMMKARWGRIINITPVWSSGNAAKSIMRGEGRPSRA